MGKDWLLGTCCSDGVVLSKNVLAHKGRRKQLRRASKGAVLEDDGGDGGWCRGEQNVNAGNGVLKVGRPVSKVLAKSATSRRNLLSASLAALCTAHEWAAEMWVLEDRCLKPLQGSGRMMKSR